MITRYSLFAALLGAILAAGAPAGASQRAIIRFNPQAPLQATPSSEDEQTALVRMLDEDDPTRRNRLITDFLIQYPTSEYMHMLLQSRWQIVLERNDDPQDLIEAAVEGLEAYQYFMESKLGFIDDPDSLDEYPSTQYRFKNQELQYYQSMVDAYVGLDEPERITEYVDLALATADETDAWFDRLGDETEDVAGMDAEAWAEVSRNTRMFLLNTVRNIHVADENEAGVVEVTERMLEIVPDDVELLLFAATALAQQQAPADEAPATLQARMERALAYADRAVEGVDLYLLRADVSEEQQAGVMAQLYSTIGLATAQLGDWTAAAEAYRAAIDATPMAPNLHYMLGIVGANSNDIEIALPAFARAHFLIPDNPDIRATLEQIYQASEGTLDGLDDYVQSEGASLGN